MKNKKYIILFILILFVLIALTVFSKKEIKSVNWDANFINTKTSPYGTYITYNLLQDIFDNEIEVTRKSISYNLEILLDEYTENYYSSEEEQNEHNTDKELNKYNNVALEDTTCYVFINKEFTLNCLDLPYLLDFVSIGNNVFISAYSIDPILTDTLGLKIDFQEFVYHDSIYTLADYADKKYAIQALYSENEINMDSCTYPHRILSESSNKNAAFVCIQFGKGKFFIHKEPNAFTNITQLNTQKYDYAYRCLSYIPKNNYIIWDEYQKQGDDATKSIFRVLLTDKALTTALILTLVGIFLFIIFRAKRIQRVIPIIKPPVNSSVEFLYTISNLYYRKKDYRTIIKKRHTYFLNSVRKNYHLSTENHDNNFLNALSAKSGVDKQIIIEIFNIYDQITSYPKTNISNDTFLNYNKSLDQFYTQSQNIK